MEFIRNYYNVLMSRICENRSKIQVLIGPRQVGKSTLMSQVLRDLTIPYTLAKADDVDPADKEWIHATWESARAAMDAHGESERLLVIDEIQKIEQWSEAVKLDWDWDTHHGRNLKVVLLGSSRLMIRDGLTESLAGRFELIRMGHWSYDEMRTAFGFTLDQYIYFGGYPGAAQFVRDESRWKKYIKDSIVSPAIEKDVILTSRIYKPALMRQLFELGCRYSSEQLSLTKAIGQLQDAGNVTTLANYLALLTDCQLLTGLQKFASDEARKYNSVPKFEVYNNALLSAFHRKSFMTAREDNEVWGRWVESAVGAHLLSAAEEDDYQVFYWRQDDCEVDFVVVADDVTIAIEVKSGRRKMNTGLPEFVRRYHPTRSLIVGTGGLSLEEFLLTPIRNLF